MGLDCAMSRGLDVDRLRADTPGCTTVVHLNNAGSALPPAVVTDTVVAHLRLEELIGGYEAHAEAEERIEAVRGTVGRLVGADGDHIALVESATEGWARALASIQFTRGIRPGDRMLVSSAEYASNVLPLLQLAARTGARLEFVPDDENGCVDVDAAARMLDDDVALVAITHCPSQNGLVNDVAGIGSLLRDSDAWYIVDACQSVGQLPVDAAAIGADFLSATGRKFVRGPRGTGFLYASPRALDELEPFPLDLHSATWTTGGYEVQSSARRYEYWEKSYATVLGLGAAADYALALGMAAAAERIQELAAYARDRLDAIPGVSVHDRGVQRSGIVTFTLAGTPAAELVPRIRAAGVNVSLSTPETSRRDFDDHRITGLVRVSPHVYNTTEEVDRLVACVASS
jgi:cysteine desulfurase / selenocysteine lyase